MQQKKKVKVSKAALLKEIARIRREYGFAARPTPRKKREQKLLPKYVRRTVLDPDKLAVQMAVIQDGVRKTFTCFEGYCRNYSTR